MSEKYTFAKIIIIPAFILSLMSTVSFFLAGHTSIPCIIAVALALGFSKKVRKKTGVKKPRWLHNMAIYSIVLSAFMFGMAAAASALGKVF